MAKKVKKSRKREPAEEPKKRQPRGERTCPICNTIVEGDRGTCPECDSPLE